MRITMRRDADGYTQIWGDGYWLGLPMPDGDGTEYESTPAGWKRIDPPEIDWLGEAVIKLRQCQSDAAGQDTVNFAHMAAAVEQASKFRDATRYTNSCWAAERDELRARIDELEAREVPPTELAKLRAELDQVRADWHALCGVERYLKTELARARERIAELEAERDMAQAGLEPAGVTAEQLSILRRHIDEEETNHPKWAEVKAAGKAIIAALDGRGPLTASERAELEQLRKLKIEAVKPATCPTRDELLPCPRCNGIVSVFQIDRGLLYEGMWMWGACGCSMASDRFVTRAQAIVAANRRAPCPTCEQLREMVRVRNKHLEIHSHNSGRRLYEERIP